MALGPDAVGVGGAKADSRIDLTMQAICTEVEHALDVFARRGMHAEPAARKARPKAASVHGDVLEVTDDHAILRRVRGGDVDAFESLITKYKGHVFAIVANHVPRDRVEEIAHDVFVAAYTSLPRYKASKPFEHWLARIALRRCYDFWRREKRSKEIPISAITDEHEAWILDVRSAQSVDDFERERARGEAKEILEWALAKLAPGDRMAVTLVHLEGYSVNEAAALLAWSVSKVKVRAHRARRRLREMIGTLLTERNG